MINTFRDREHIDSRTLFRLTAITNLTTKILMMRYVTEAERICNIDVINWDYVVTNVSKWIVKSHNKIKLTKLNKD